MKKIVVLIIITVIIMIISACSTDKKPVVETELTVVKYDKNQLVHDADVIMRGTVTSIVVQKDYDGFPATDTTILVNEVYKGNPGKEVEVRVKGGETEDMIYVPEKDKIPDFKEGEEVIVFLTNNKGNRPDKDEFGYYVVGQIQGKFEVKESNNNKSLINPHNSRFGFDFNDFKEQIDTISKENENPPPHKSFHDEGEESDI